MAYMSSKKSRTLHTTPLENCVPALLTLQQYMTTSIDTTSFHPLETDFQTSKCLDLTEELYWPTYL